MGSLFSGVGALDLGLEWAGWDTRWFCEVDPFCRDILAKRFPGRTVYDDACALPADAEHVDMLAGGFPCQPVSLAGRGLAQDDPRWLWPAFERAIRVLRPGLVLVENVLGLVARGLADVLGGLAALGFDAAWTVFGASDVGAPHRRRRLWLAAAHPERVALRVEPRRIFGPGWADEALARLDGPSRHVADARGERRDGRKGRLDRRRHPTERDEARHHPGDGGGAPPRVADADLERRDGGSGQLRPGRRAEPADRGGAGDAPHPDGEGSPDGCGPARAAGGGFPARGDGWWTVEPDVGRVAHGVAGRVDRLRALGNGVVPACAELVGARILDVIGA